MLAAATMLVSCLAAAHAAPADRARDLANMVQTEYDFSETAKKEGYKASFLKYLSEDNIMFADGPVKGRERVASRPELPGLLQWYPDYAVVANTGDVGLSAGPWVFSKDGQRIAFGHFFSIWRKQPDGHWRNALDIGIDHDEIKPAPAGFKVSVPAAAPAEAASTTSTDRSRDIRAAELEFSRLAGVSGYVVAAERMAHPELRVYRNGHAPVVGAKPAVAFLKDQTSVGPTKLDFASGSGDFGYAYGTIAKPSGVGSSHVFVHVWKHDNGRWQLLGDLWSPVPDKAQ
jgi:ketosteroid isomerase-like protein